jgi:lipopolysaccharide/colanic/teichoic acid biosynthesis glycosyltransferase
MLANTATALSVTAPAHQLKAAAAAISYITQLPQPPFTGSKERWRVYAYARMLVADLLAIALALATIQTIGGKSAAEVAHPPFILLITFYIFVALKLGAYSIGALKDPIDAGRRCAAAMAAAVAIVAATATLLSAKITSIGFVEAMFSAGVLMLIRIRLGQAIGEEGAWTFANELILVDGAVANKSERPYIDAHDLGIYAGARDPRTLHKLGELLKHCERVILDVPAERRPAWLETLRGIDIKVEILAPELDAVRPVGVDEFQGRATAVVRSATLPLSSRVVKRSFDVFVSGVALVLLSPLLLVLAACIKLGSPGPAFFRQIRVGRGNRQFQVLKFRTMYHGSVDILGNKSVCRHDDRVTPLGRFMRNTSLDELPQLFNVLRGDMSVVGPRPHALGSRAGGELFWEADPRYWDRHSTKPGMTGLAQIRGQRGGTSTEAELINRLESDLEYIRKWSFLEDLSIILRTLRVIVHRNAF